MFLLFSFPRLNQKVSIKTATRAVVSQFLLQLQVNPFAYQFNSSLVIILRKQSSIYLFFVFFFFLFLNFNCIFFGLDIILMCTQI